MEIDMNNQKKIINIKKKRINFLKRKEFFNKLFKHRYEILFFSIILLILIFPEASGSFLNYVYNTFINQFR